MEETTPNQKLHLVMDGYEQFLEHFHAQLDVSPEWVLNVMKHPTTGPFLAGAAVGAAAGWILPVVTWPIGLAAGAGYVLYNRIKK